MSQAELSCPWSHPLVFLGTAAGGLPYLVSTHEYLEVVADDNFVFSLSFPLQKVHLVPCGGMCFLSVLSAQSWSGQILMWFWGWLLVIGKKSFLSMVALF